jgi:hypothetical protein
VIRWVFPYPLANGAPKQDKNYGKILSSQKRAKNVLNLSYKVKILDLLKGIMTLVEVVHIYIYTYIQI